MSAAIRLEGISFARGKTLVLDDLSLDVAAGEVVALLGPSGSGKSTVLRIIMGLEVPERGEVTLGDRLATSGRRLLVSPEQRGLAVVFQDLALWPHLSVSDNLAFGLRARGVAAGQRQARIARALDRVGLSELARRLPGQLSGGEQQRAAIARALVLEPSAVLLDEPLSNLDVFLRDELLDLFASLFEEAHATVLYVTHDPGEAKRLASRVAILDGGRVVFSGPLEDVPRDHESAFARRVSR